MLNFLKINIILHLINIDIPFKILAVDLIGPIFPSTDVMMFKIVAVDFIGLIFLSADVMIFKIVAVDLIGPIFP